MLSSINYKKKRQPWTNLNKEIILGELSFGQRHGQQFLEQGGRKLWERLYINA
jgi:hypothetical protein